MHHTLDFSRGFLGGTVIKNPPTNAGDTRDAVLIPGWRRSPGGGNGNPLQYSCLDEGTLGFLPRLEKDRESASKCLESRFPYHDSRATTRSPSHAHEDLTSLAPHERLPEILVVPREKTPTGAAARGNP